jgi:hypothetical protein
MYATFSASVVRRDVYDILNGKSEGKKQLGRPRNTRQGINIDLEET